MTQRLDQAFARIDEANAADPNMENGQPAELLYGQRMTEEQRSLYPDASEPLQIACRGQHIERWTLPRSDFPDDRKGYLNWRTEQGRRHAARVAGIMAEAGYTQDQIGRAEKMLQKQGIKRDDEVQALEDVAVFTFMRHYMAPFSETQTPEEMDRIVRLTARKMSAGARARALAEFPIPEPLAAYFRDEP
ncbi:DUF4202 domain-containing protein [Paracoccus aerodenitrificans]|uniref:DUF4202 domain-containing protein n=1 Tax=Paracoccus aerodenitrificans TaxID=3017781 RepID=UPI0022F12D60|nr:DUF4202 domain-containing protein [Paracoccus aerodenitrificans]WBU62837.1 DUF4202 domain-containing protein [Paracoccus aerodenitrificans]